MECLRDASRAVRRKKLMSSYKPSKSSLVRCLSTADLSFVGIGCMLGSGVYVLTGEVAAEVAGPAAPISFLISGIVALFAALCYTECATRNPEGGASYLYAYVSMGELAGFLMGWNSIIIRILGVSFVSRGWSAYFDTIIGSRVYNFTMVILDGNEWDLPLLSPYPDLLAGLVSLAACVIVALGTELSAKASRAFVVVNLITVLTVMTVAFVYADYNHLIDHGGFAPMGFEGIITGAAASFPGYAGFEAIAFAAEEAKNPRKGLPISICVSFIVAILCYMGGSFAIVILANWQDIDPVSPFVSAFDAVDAKWMALVVAVGALCSMTGGVIGCAYCYARAIFVMGRDELIPAIFAQTNSSSHTPTVATLFGGCISIIISIFINFADLVEFLSLLMLVEFVVVAMACILMRYNPELESWRQERYRRYVSEEKKHKNYTEHPKGATSGIMGNQRGNDRHCSNTDESTPLLDVSTSDYSPQRVDAVTASQSHSSEVNDIPSFEMTGEGSGGVVVNGRRCSRFFSTSINSDGIGERSTYIDCIGERTPLLSTPPILSHIPPSRKKTPRLLWSNNNPVKTAVSSLLVIIATTVVIVWIVTYKIEEITGGANILAFILIVAAMLFVTACVPLCLMKQYPEGIPFKVPLMPSLPLVSMVFNIILMTRFEPLTWIELSVWVGIGLIVYFAYGMRHSKEAKVPQCHSTSPRS